MLGRLFRLDVMSPHCSLMVEVLVPSSTGLESLLWLWFSLTVVFVVLHVDGTL